MSSYHHGSLASALLEAAELELSKSGTEAFSLRAVAKSAGVSHGAPANHFKGKKGLLTALAAQGYERLIKVQNDHQRKAQSTPEAQLVASGIGYINFAIENPELFRLMFTSSQPDRNDDHFGEASMAAFNKLVIEVENVLSADPYSDRAAMRQVMASWSMVHGLTELVISGRTEIPMNLSQMTSKDREAMLESILRMALRKN